jgi:hypothetical protein
VPPGIVFDPDTRTFSGTPTGPQRAQIITITGTDREGARATASFSFTAIEPVRPIIEADPAPLPTPTPGPTPISRPDAFIPQPSPEQTFEVTSPLSSVGVPVFEASAAEAEVANIGTADLLTTTRGFITRVDPTGFVGGQHDLRVDKAIPDLTFNQVGASFNYQIPIDAFVHSDPGAEVTLSALMLDGTQLPLWLIFDSERGEVRGVIPEDFAGEMIIRVIARDEAGRQADTLLRILREGEVLESQVFLEGRPELDDQFATYGVLGWRAEQQEWVRLAREAAEQVALAKAS